MGARTAAGPPGPGARAVRIAGMPERSFMRAKGDASMGEYTDKAKGKIKQGIGEVKEDIEDLDR